MFESVSIDRYAAAVFGAITYIAMGGFTTYTYSSGYQVGEGGEAWLNPSM